MTAAGGAGRRVVGATLAGLLLGAACSSGSSEPSASGAGDTSFLVTDCRRADLDGRSVARVWDEALLDAIRRDVPAPTVHARNLFHVSAAMWDAWSAYEPDATGYLVDEAQGADGADGVDDAEVTAAREAAMSYAAYRILLDRYSRASGLQETFDELVSTMDALCYRIDVVTTEGPSPAALGNRIAAAYIDRGRSDGAHEESRYTDSDYTASNDPLVVAEAGTSMRDPNHWQPLALDQLVAQNGVPIPGKVQQYVGSHWGGVEGFALPPVGLDGDMPVDPGPPPRLGDDPAAVDEFGRQAVAVVRASASLDATERVTVDISPGARGDSHLGTDDGDGHDTNPATGEPYPPDRVLRGDVGRVLAEFWADGPDSETPPGHWNTVANEVSDSPELDRRIGGEGGEVPRLEWDVKLYFALNGAVHDAAVAAWGAKHHYDSVRPISMIRYLGGRGQSSDPVGPAYDPVGLPLEPGLIEVVTPESSAPGQRHEHLADHVGEVAVRTWRGTPDDPSETSGVGWIRAVEWVPYQKPTFVTPAFAGYVSGHSTFSRAAAEVMAAITGSEYFPGGMAEWTTPAGGLGFESGPTEDVTLQWATYFDAADQAGVSRIYGGIHIPADDYAGRRLGATCGRDAWALAQRYYAGDV
jgi:hypothetical protein